MTPSLTTQTTQSQQSNTDCLPIRNLIKENTILVVDADKGRVKSSFGANIFYMPHGLHVDGAGNTWVTDVGLHQVMKFEAGQTKPSLGNFA